MAKVVAAKRPKFDFGGNEKMVEEPMDVSETHPDQTNSNGVESKQPDEIPVTKEPIKSLDEFCIGPDSLLVKFISKTDFPPESKKTGKMAEYIERKIVTTSPIAMAMLSPAGFSKEDLENQLNVINLSDPVTGYSIDVLAAAHKYLQYQVRYTNSTIVIPEFDPSADYDISGGLFSGININGEIELNLPTDGKTITAKNIKNQQIFFHVTVLSQQFGWKNKN